MFGLSENDIFCSICGGKDFRFRTVLWPELIREWQLSEYERDYIDRQQGCNCLGCNANLRVVALGDALRFAVGTALTIRDSVNSGALDRLRVLDCNGAEGLSQALSKLPGYQRADYPDYDMRALPFEDQSFDLVIHSDTLEHIDKPIVALEECRRVLRPAGQLCFTVPVIHGRLTRSRSGLPPSYHGAPDSNSADLIVHTEFGADTWSFLYQAGFTRVTINHVAFPAATAFTAHKTITA